MNFLFTKKIVFILAVFSGKCLFSLENSDGVKKKKPVSPPWLLSDALPSLDVHDTQVVIGKEK